MKNNYRRISIKLLDNIDKLVLVIIPTMIILTGVDYVRYFIELSGINTFLYTPNMSNILISIFGIFSMASLLISTDSLVVVLLSLVLYLAYILFLYSSLKFFSLREDEVKKKDCNCINKVIHYYFKIHKYFAAILAAPIIFILFILTIIFPLIIGDEAAKTRLTQVVSKSIEFKVEHIGFAKDDKYNYVAYPLKAKTCRILIDDPKAEEKIETYNNLDNDSIDLFNCYPFSGALKKAVYKSLEKKKDNEVFKSNNGFYEEMLKTYKVGKN